uniref:Uncharacterized protein n=1 Tax=Nelumbo nucifera TaxID=4432 RepID=A0A822ZQZ5_NELNU|nr:TPA_asm: hypothetical protein HUJ06_004161 [Nelumbo nucifera]
MRFSKFWHVAHFPSSQCYVHSLLSLWYFQNFVNYLLFFMASIYRLLSFCSSLQRMSFSLRGAVEGFRVGGSYRRFSATVASEEAIFKCQDEDGQVEPKVLVMEDKIANI